MIRSVYEIARHELQVVLRTKRAAAVATLYLAFAILGGLAYVMIVRSIEQGAMKMMVEQGATEEQAEQTVDVIGEQAYEKILAFVADSEPEKMANTLKSSAILPVILWGTLAFLPLLILLTSFDQVASDLQSRSICYSILRADRTSILLGKAAAQAVIFISLTVFSSTVLMLFAGALLQNFEWGTNFLGMVRLWIILVPFGMCYLGISAFASTAVRHPFLALLIAIGILIFLRMMSWMRLFPEDSSAGFLRHFQWLSPASYEKGFWLTGLTDPMLSALAYLVFGAIFMAGAALLLQRRDL